MANRMSCQEVEPLLFDLRERDLELAERQHVYAHLAICRECRDLERSEAALSQLLTAHRRNSGENRRKTSALPFVAAVAAVVIGLVLLPPFFEADKAASGSITSYDMVRLPGSPRAVSRAIAAENRIQVEAGSYSKVQVDDVGEFSVSGPASFVLRMNRRVWALDLFSGSLHARVFAGAECTLSTPVSTTILGEGIHIVSAEQDEKQDEDQVSVASRLHEAMRLYYARLATEPDSTRKAMKLFAEVRNHKKATKAQVQEARFYYGACLGQLGENEKALKEGEAFIRDYPQAGKLSIKRFFVGLYALRLGKTDLAKKHWDAMMKTEGPDSNFTKSALQYLKKSQETKTAAPRAGVLQQEKKKHPYMSGRLDAASQNKGGYLVVRTALKKHPGFAKVADEVARFHQAATIDFDGENMDALAKALRQFRPENVLFVVPPTVFDVQLHRRILLLSYQIDKDVFSDFAFGYFTARDAGDLRALWKRTKAAHKKKPGERKLWISTGVTSGIKSTIYKGSIPAVARSAGYKGETIYWSCIEADPGVMKFVGANLPRLEDADVVTFSGNSDPQGIWLFSDRRNLDRSKHWPYDPKKVGHDPDNTMPRIEAARLAALNLNNPIVWSGTCHSAATQRVWVEGDIVSTFGRTDNKGVLHLLDPDKSLGLAMIRAGATAYMAPIGANHGMSAAMEEDFAIIEGATLGETMKSTYDDLALAAGGNLVLDFVEEGKPVGHSEYVMQGGGANRVLIGDPALRPFAAHPHPLESVKVKNAKKGSFEVEVKWREGYHARFWDIYRNQGAEPRRRDGRIPVRIALDRLVPTDAKVQITTTAQVTDEQGLALPFDLMHGVGENYHGRRYLHLQVNAARKDVDRKAMQATFKVTYK